MSERSTAGGLTRRGLLTAGLGAAAVTAVGRPWRSDRPAFAAARIRAAAPATREMHLAATDGFVSMPTAAAPMPPFWPDPLAPAGQDLYVFGFRDVTAFSSDPVKVKAQRGRAQISAPILAFDQETDVKVTLTNLGLSVRPDLVDGHTIHWHGFANAVPLFDGVPELSMAVPIGRDFTYFYRPHDAGTFMYHCHFEDVEHVQMGMTGSLFVYPMRGGTVSHKHAYDHDGTAFDREYSFMLGEIWADAHYRDAHIQTTDWTDFHPSFFTLNGRAWPDTVEGPQDPMDDNAGRLQFQPISSRIWAVPGERVLLRLANLGYRDHAITVDDFPLTIVAKDARLMADAGGASHFETVQTVNVGPGESRDVIFTAPDVGEYLLYDRSFSYLSNGAGPDGVVGYGGMMTRISVVASRGPQSAPNA